ncbi:hypothetical protein AVEN_87888-1 [Araneus ventricosus]|uniref:Uncharacterized protein n=1 Tax=Araneus ventricosus TaxID=182803 RepID=A0A4Y2BDJ7_ARAVE|nr:hypothetical protein AVEN_87888-1 [Araneus ventricosus]
MWTDFVYEPKLAIQRTNGELSVSRNGVFGEERLREDLERLRWQRILSEIEAVSTEKRSEDLESDVQPDKQPERCIIENPLKATAYGLADSENKGGHANTCVGDDELSNDECTGPFYGGNRDISG